MILENNLKIHSVKKQQLKTGSSSEKFEVYLQAGVQSCWLVIPPTKTIVLFQDIQQPLSCSSGRFTDPVIELEVAVDDIFS